VAGYAPSSAGGTRRSRRPKKVAERALISTLGRLPVPSDVGENRVVVICYHSVHPTLRAAARPDLFRRHLDWLKRHCTVVGLDSIRRHLTSGGEASPRPVVAITFDDGYVDNFELAYPVLVELELTATFFVVPGLTERDRSVVERMQAQRRILGLRGMSWAQIRELHDAGFGIGSHTYGHRVLAGLARHEAETEVERGKALIEERLGTEIRLFAYPFGIPGRHVTRESVEVVRAAGCTTAVAILHRRVKASDHPLLTPRFIVRDDDVPMFGKKIGGASDFIGEIQERLPRRHAVP
jgi:peptidoglycan/xylan/chitin deacetylase (PgdA/CDA1 family)